MISRRRALLGLASVPMGAWGSGCSQSDRRPPPGSAESYVASCRTTTVCSAELAAYHLCGGVCGQFQHADCTGGQSSCDCRQKGCGGFDAPELRYACTQETTAIACDCFLGGVEVGSCKAYGGECAGPIAASCCGALVYTPNP